MPSELDFSVLDPANAVLTLRADLRFTPADFDGDACYMIEDPVRGKFFRIGGDEFTLISLLDGKNTIAQAIGISAATLARTGLHRKRGDVGLPLAVGIATGRLRRGGPGRTPRRVRPQTGPQQARRRRQSPGHADSVVQSQRACCNCDPPWTHWLFTPPAVVAWCIVCLIGADRCRRTPRRTGRILVRPA